MELEAAAAAAASAIPASRHAQRNTAGAGRYRFGLRNGGPGPITADPAPVFASILEDLERATAPAAIALAFHTAVADLVAGLCVAARERHGLRTVVLSGGVFANALLSSGCTRRLRGAGFQVLRHCLVPPNDGGLALGQAVIAGAASVQPELPVQCDEGGTHVPGGTRPGHRGA
jgi:hydrogenase maturation protein HypF